jgi:hypothetical protein
LWEIRTITDRHGVSKNVLFLQIIRGIQKLISLKHGGTDYQKKRDTRCTGPQ